MENNIQIFNNPEFGEIRTVEIDNEPWFVGKDVAVILGYSNPQKAIRDHIDEDDRTVNESFTVNGTAIALINESGLYSLVLSSKLPTAKKFKRWVTSEVLPSIRKHGAYLTQETLQEALCNPDTLFQIVSSLKEESDKRKALEAKNSELEVAMTIAAPKVEYYEELCARGALTGIYETAKLLGVPPRKFTEDLVKHHYLFRNKKGVLMPCEDKNNGLFEVKEVFSDNNRWSGSQTLITFKGRDVFRMMRLGI